jgi:DNA invertase Pin-like site-specific DNA recombinase
MTVYGYRRVSTAEQQDGASLEQQTRMIRGASLIHECDAPVMFEDIISGSVPLTERPNGGRLWTMLQKGDLLIASKLDRVFRSAEDALTTTRLFQERGINLVLVDLGTEPITAIGVGRLFLAIMASIAEFERWRIRERVSEGRKGKKAKGGHVGGDAPFGYGVNGHGRDAVLVEIDEEQATITLARRLRADRLSLREVSRQLAASGRYSRSGEPFSAIQIARMVDGQTPLSGAI